MADSNLPTDVDVDGECVSVFKPPKFNLPAKSKPLHETDYLWTHKNSKQDLSETRHESGYGSFQPSLSSSGYQSSSLDVTKFESVDEKSPIQCSDECAAEQVTDLSSELSKLDLQNTDDGIELDLDENEDNFDLEDAFTEEDSDGDTILHNSILNSMVSVGFCLIELCPNVDILNMQNKLFQTPLHLAVLTNLSEVVRKLVNRGANVLMRDQQGNTPLHIACRTGNKAIIETLVESVKNDSKSLHKLFTLKNSEGLTCLHIAAEGKHYIVMGYLFANGADVNIGDAKSGRTVLHYAVERNDMKTVKVLLTHKDIDVDCVTFKGESPLVIAYWRNYQDIVKKLRSKGAYFSFDLVDEWDEEETSY